MNCASHTVDIGFQDELGLLGPMGDRGPISYGGTGMRILSSAEPDDKLPKEEQEGNSYPIEEGLYVWTYVEAEGKWMWIKVTDMQDSI